MDLYTHESYFDGGSSAKGPTFLLMPMYCTPVEEIRSYLWVRQYTSETRDEVYVTVSSAKVNFTKDVHLPPGLPVLIRPR